MEISLQQVSKIKTTGRLHYVEKTQRNKETEYWGYRRETPVKYLKDMEEFFGEINPVVCFQNKLRDNHRCFQLFCFTVIRISELLGGHFENTIFSTYIVTSEKKTTYIRRQ